MFGTRLRTWMEAHIARAKKKKDRKKGDKGFDSSCSSPSNHSSSRSPAPHQVYPLNSPVEKNVDSIRLRTGSYTTTGVTPTSSSGASGTSGGTAGSVNLSSPESAYSTGYSTDGTSPGASYPPEYYINIRTGTHYFQSGKAASRAKNGGLVAVATTPPLALGNGNGAPAENNRRDLMGTAAVTMSSGKNSRDVRTSTPNKGYNCPIKGIQRQDERHHQETFHRRAESYSADSSSRSSMPVPSSIPPPLVSPPVQSPRERSRIRTNPWLSANSSGSSTTGGFKSRLTLDESSSSSGLKLTESSGSASDVNVNNLRDGRAKREYRQESLSAGRSPINQNWRMLSSMEVRNKIHPLVIQRCNSSSSSTSSITRSLRSSEDDITLNEMMGKFDESYIYEKETDILSDSDPTDCDDYIDSPTDIDTGQDGGDENDPFENDEFDYIDNGSFLALDNLDPISPFRRNTGHCSYILPFEMKHRIDRIIPAETFVRRKETNGRGGNVKRQNVNSSRAKKLDDKSGDKRKRRASHRRKYLANNYDEDVANLNRVLIERMLLKNSGFNQGSRSVGGTPICLRRKKHDVNKNLSPLRTRDERASSRTSTSAVYENDIFKRRSNSVSYMNGNIMKHHQISGSTYMATFASEIALIEADKEADKKYRELIMEAENILINMQRNHCPSPVVAPSPRKVHNGLANKRVELIKNTELNIELALSKSRNSQPELQCGSIKDIERTSPKRQFTQPCSPVHRFIERNGTSGMGNGLIKENSYRQEPLNCPSSPIMQRKILSNSPSKSLKPMRVQATELEAKSYSYNPTIPHNINGNMLRDRVYTNLRDITLPDRRDFRVLRTQKEDGLTSSSSDSDDKYEMRMRAPLMTFKSIDMGPVRRSSYCPQSEPVKRKVYAGSATYGRIQKTLGEQHVILRNSDGDTANDDTDGSRRSLREKVSQLRQERQALEVNGNFHDPQHFNYQITQLRRQMLMQTIEGLKRSLEDQSATLKQTCLESVINGDN